MIRRAAQLLLVGAFAVGIFLPPLLWLRHLAQPAVLSDEGRQATALPRLHPVARFPSAFEVYYRDVFGLRGSLFHSYALARAELFGISPTPSVVMGRDGWLFLGDDQELEQFRGTRRLSADELRAWVDVLRARLTWLRARAIPYLLVIAPDKTTIYPEELPRGTTPIGPTPLDQLVRSARDARLPLLDLRPALALARAQERVYDRTDSHWNERGAFAGAEAIVSALRESFPQMPPLRRADFQDVAEEWPTGGDLARMMGLADRYREQALLLRPLAPGRARVGDASGFASPAPGRPVWQVPLVRETGDPALPSALVLRDSFTTRLEPFLSERFRRAVYLFTDDLDGAVVARERPDVVLEIMVERFVGARAPPRNRRLDTPGAQVAADDRAPAAK